MVFINVEINLLEYRPSVIAAAATFVALDQKLTRTTLESKMKSISNCKFLKIVSFVLFSCTFSFTLNIIKHKTEYFILINACWSRLYCRKTCFYAII